MPRAQTEQEWLAQQADRAAERLVADLRRVLEDFERNAGRLNRPSVHETDTLTARAGDLVAGLYAGIGNMNVANLIATAGQADAAGARAEGSAD